MKGLRRRGSRHSQLVSACIAALRAWGYVAFNVKNIGTPHLKADGGIRWSRGLITPGVADVIACSPHGRFVAAEVKVTPDKLRLEQMVFRADIVHRGGTFIEVRDTVDALLQAHKEGQL